MNFYESSPPTNHSSFLKALLIGSFLIFAAPKPADAFCIQNQTDTRLVFAARIKGKAGGGLIFSQWVKSGMKTCGTLERGTDILEVFVFADPNSVEGCDDEIAAEGTLSLHKFEEFDNCVWGK